MKVLTGELIKSKKKNFQGHLRSFRGRNFEKITNRKIYHSVLFVKVVFGTLSRAMTN